MYFGTRRMFKSVCGIKRAAVLGWQHLYRHTRIGAVINTAEKQFIYSPHSQERHYLSILKNLSTSSTRHPHFTQIDHLHDLLLTMQSQLRAGHFLFIISDFLNFDLAHQQIIAYCAQRASVQLIFVYDPLEAYAPPANLYSLTDGKLILSFDTTHIQTRDHYQEQFTQNLNRLIKFSRQYHLALQIIRTDQA
jgi:hypothetical protein